MKTLFFVALVMGVAILGCAATELHSWTDEMTNAVTLVRDQLTAATHTMETVNRQMMLQHFYQDERVRSEGFSGIKIPRSHFGGSENYFAGSHNNYKSFSSIHDHAENKDTLGLAELDVILNGVEFRTRHNDYRLVMPSRTSSDLHATEPIPFPEVPVEVTSKVELEDQIDEMRSWFKAWRDQDHSVRDYRQYFKPVLCYLEGAWMEAGENVDESFNSLRHRLDAHTWENLHDISKYLSETGYQQRSQNIPMLPTRVDKVSGADTTTVQWNYRILCHPLENDLPLNRFHLTDDLAAKMTANLDDDKFLHSRHARFQLNPKDRDDLYESLIQHELLDELMEQIPGKDNYIGDIKGVDVDGDSMLDMDGITEKNIAKYHRMFKLGRKDASGLQHVNKGFSDRYMFAARTTQEKVSAAHYESCKRWNPTDCYSKSEKWSYAIPLEVVYLTPLSKWNPYDLEYKGEWGDDGAGDTASAGGRYGSCTNPSKTLNGINSYYYYQTPPQFYDGLFETEQDTSDSGRWDACVNDRNGAPVKVRGSGTRILLPPIRNVGIMRLRYPIMPVSSEGSSVWKELNALRKAILNRHEYRHLMNEPTIDNAHRVMLAMTYTGTGEHRHTHLLRLEKAEYLQIKAGYSMVFTTKPALNFELSDGHTHKIEVRWSDTHRHFYANKCDDQSTCDHGRDLHVVTLGDDLDMNKLF